MNVNGLEIDITQGSLQEVFALQKAISNALRDKGIDFSLTGLNIDKVLNTEIGDSNIGAILDMGLSVITDTEIRNCLFTLGKRANINRDGVKSVITPEFFEAPENRKHYFPVMGAIMKENILPFFQGLNLGSLIPAKWSEAVQRSK